MERDRLAWVSYHCDGEDRDIPGRSDIDTVDHDRLPVGMRMRTANTLVLVGVAGFQSEPDECWEKDIESQFRLVLVYTARLVLLHRNIVVNDVSFSK
jgi:hypothetical protein